MSARSPRRRSPAVLDELAQEGHGERYAKREYKLLWDLARLDTPAVEPVAVITGRTAKDGSPLDSALVVDAGHHQRRLLRLTGIDAEENQARRLLNDLDSFRVAKGLRHEDEAIVAHRWLAEAFQPVVSAVPAELRRKLEQAQLFHEVLDHHWFLSEAAGKDVGLEAAVRSYVDNVLVFKPDEKAIITPGDPQEW